MTLIPMTGVDFVSRSEVLTAFVRGDKFRNEDTHQVVTRLDVEADSQKEVLVRYHGLRRTVTFELDSNDNWKVRQ
jgi:hypothetical protein